MKKFNLTLAVAILTSLFIACSEPTKEDLIKKAFKEYVNNNFDDPNDLKEIVSIEVRDTAKNAILELVSDIHKLDSLMLITDSLVLLDLNNTAEQLSGTQKTLANLGYYEKNEIKRLGYEYLDCFMKYSKFDKRKIKTAKEEIDSITNIAILTMPNIELYNIITRVNIDNKLKLANFYALADSTNIRIYKEEPAFKEYSEEIGVLAEKIDAYFEEQQTLGKLIDSLKEKLNEFKERCIKSGIFIY